MSSKNSMTSFFLPIRKLRALLLTHRGLIDAHTVYHVVDTTRRDRAATTIQAMARGVAGREMASDERNRRNRINELLRVALKRLGGPVFREWRDAAHDHRQVRAKECSMYSIEQ